ncbi:MAG: hypothetical protein ACYC5Q_12315 [Thermoleophilia bacterium]
MDNPCNLRHPWWIIGRLGIGDLPCAYKHSSRWHHVGAHPCGLGTIARHVPREAFSQVQGETDLSFGGRTYGETIRAYEATVGAQGRWEVERNPTYQSFFEGDEDGVLWIVTYDAPGTDRIPELEFHVKRFTGDVSLREPNLSFLSRYQLEEYLSKEKE